MPSIGCLFDRQARVIVWEGPSKQRFLVSHIAGQEGGQPPRVLPRAGELLSLPPKKMTVIGTRTQHVLTQHVEWFPTLCSFCADFFSLAKQTAANLRFRAQINTLRTSGEAGSDQEGRAAACSAGASRKGARPCTALFSLQRLQLLFALRFRVAHVLYATGGRSRYAPKLPQPLNHVRTAMLPRRTSPRLWLIRGGPSTFDAGVEGTE